MQMIGNAAEGADSELSSSSKTLRQERPEDVPTGELLRAMTLVADRHLVFSNSSIPIEIHF